MNRLATASVMLGLGGLLLSACGGASDETDQSFSAGAGTEVHIAEDQSIADLQFVLNGLTSADGVAHAGTLKDRMR